LMEEEVERVERGQEPRAKGHGRSVAGVAGSELAQSRPRKERSKEDEREERER
jgi:hypothetical protein